MQVNYPVESTGKICYLDLPDTPFVYFKNPQDSSQ